MPNERGGPRTGSHGQLDRPRALSWSLSAMGISVTSRATQVEVLRSVSQRACSAPRQPLRQVRDYPAALALIGT